MFRCFKIHPGFFLFLLTESVFPFVFVKVHFQYIWMARISDKNPCSLPDGKAF